LRIVRQFIWRFYGQEFFVESGTLFKVPSLDFGVIGAIIATSVRGLDNDVYFQVGLLTTPPRSAPR